MELRVSLANQLKALSFLIFGTLLMLATLIVLDFQTAMLISFGSIWFVLALPSLYLHVEYLLINTNTVLEVGNNQLLLKTASGAVNKIYSFDELRKIVLFKSASLDRGGFPMTPIEMYHYARITTATGEEIIITCLMTPDVEEILKKIKRISYERKKQLFSSINFSTNR